MIDPSRPDATAGLPLTEAQEGLWYAQRIDPDNPIYNTGQYFDIRGVLDVETFRRAVDQAVSEADGLAIRVVDGRDGPTQIVDEAQRARLEVIDLRGSADAEAQARERMRRDMETPLDPTRDRLAAERLFLIGDERAFWYQRTHHLAIDAYGYAILTRRICDLYTAQVRGQAPRTGALGSYTALLAQDVEYRSSAKREASRAFWHTEFADRPDVVGLEAGDAVTAREYRRCDAELPASLEPALRGLAEASATPWPDVLVALVAAYLARHAGGGEVIAGVPSMERLGTVAVNVPAIVMNVLPFRVSVDEDVPLHEYLQGVAQRLRERRRHGRYRGEQLRRDLGLVSHKRRLHGALINVVPFERLPELPGATIAVHILGTGPVDDLTVTLRAAPGGGGLRLELDANPNLYSETRVAEHGARLAAFLVAAIGATRLADVPTLTPQEQRRWVQEVNDTAHPVEDTTLTALLEASMRRTPDAEAVVSEEESLTYADLDRRSGILAGALRDAGVRRGDIVAVALPRSVEQVLSLVATLRAGAAYLPLDLSYPPERLAVTLRLAQPRVVLTSAAARAALTTTATVMIVGEVEKAASGATEPMHPVDPADAAYVIYTSGSTGEPKGVVVEHRAIVNRLEWMRVHYGIDAADRILQKTPATFDVSVWEYFLPLIAGATLVVAPPDAHKDPAWLAALIRKHRVTTMHFVPSMLDLFVADPNAAGLRLKRVFCSGEALPAPLRDRFHATIEAELHNLYGPTEAAVDVTFWNASKGDASVPVPIGHPVWNTQMYVLDARMRPVPAGVTGDLYIGGVQLAREYLGRPDLTHDRFVPDPFAGGGARLYKTGDLAQWRDDGALLFLGRSDHQVKIRGFRIELGEIEAVVQASALVSQVAVIARQAPAGDHQLVAYIVPSEGVTLDLDAVRAAVQRQLPDYMVPAAFVVLAELPLTSSGKLNRAALPAPVAAVTGRGRLPETATERRLAALFAEVLSGDLAPSEALGADDDFFALGGHSLMAARLMARVRQEWQCELGLGVIFANATIARLAAAIDVRDSVGGGSPVSTDQGLGPLIRLVDAGGVAPALFCMHPAGGISWCYGGLARALTPSRDVYGLQAPGLDLTCPIPERLEDLAADYVDLLRRTQPRGPYHLVGWSVGGIIAHAMAVRLQSLGETVGTLAMLDAYPSDRWRSQPEPEEGAALRALLLIAGHDPSALADVPLTRESVIGFLRRQRHALGELSDDALAGVIRVVESNNGLVRRYFHQKFAGSLLYFRAALDHLDDGLDPRQWRPYVSGAIEVHDVPAVHAHLTGPEAVAWIAPVLGGRLKA